MINFKFDTVMVNELMKNSFIKRIHSIATEKRILVICKDGFLRMISFSEKENEYGKIIWHDSLPDEDYCD